MRQRRGSAPKRCGACVSAPLLAQAKIGPHVAALKPWGAAVRRQWLKDLALSLAHTILPPYLAPVSKCALGALHIKP